MEKARIQKDDYDYNMKILEKNISNLDSYNKYLKENQTITDTLRKATNKIDELVPLLKKLTLQSLSPTLATPEGLKTHLSIFEATKEALLTIDIKGDTKYNDIKQTIIDAVEQLVLSSTLYAQTIEESKNRIQKRSQQIVESLTEIIYDASVVTGSSVNDFQTRAKFYFSADLGVAVVPTINKALPYIGTNLYFRPVNKERRLVLKDVFCKSKVMDELGRRFSLLIGLSVISLAKADQREDLLGGGFNLITGAGFRVADAIRLNGGYVWFRGNENPLETKFQIKQTPFLSISFDIDVRTVFNRLFNTEVLQNNSFYN